MLETLYGTGIRRRECSRLDLMDLDLSQATLLVRNGKGRKDRLVPVPGRAAVAIDVYLRESRPNLARDPRETALFLSREGQRLHPTTIHLLVRKHARAARLPLPPSCMGSGTPARRTSWPAAPTWATSSVSWGTAASKRRRFTPRWASGICGRH